MKNKRFSLQRWFQFLAAGGVVWLHPLAAHGVGTLEADELEALLNQPVYAASKFAQDAAKAPAAVTVLTAGDIHANGWRTLAEALNSIRGVYLRYDRYYNYLGVRGFARPGDFSSRLLVMIDGMRVNDNIYDQAGVGREFPLNVELIERIEFIPGPGSALYGSNAVLGVVNIITKTAASLLGGKVAVALGGHGSRALSLTNGLEWGEARVVVSAKKEIRPGGDLFFSEFNNPATNNGVNAGADRETDQKLYAKWRKGNFTAATVLSERQKHIPTGAFGTDFPSPHTRTQDRYGLLDVQWQHTLNIDQQLFVRSTLGQYDFGGQFDYTSSSGGIQQLQQRGRWLDTEVRWQHTGWQRQRVMVGLEAQRNLMQRQRADLKSGASSSTMADINGTSQRWGLFANNELALREDLRAVLGLRFDQQLNGTHTTTPRLALLWDATPGLVIKLLDGRAYREPNAFESQYQDNTAVANPQLRSETLRASELAADWRVLPNLRLAASIYQYKVNNLIEQQADATTGLLSFNNVGAVNAQGTELEADYVGTSGWRLRTSWASQRAKNDQAAAQISNSPTTLAKLNLSVPLPAVKSRLGLEWQHVGKRLTLANNSLPSHSVANATFQFTPPGSRLSLSASLYNLLNQTYADPGGPELQQDSLTQDGRQWRLELVWQY
jgi:outer membrane receptor protein involved in Fe transport